MPCGTCRTADVCVAVRDVCFVVHGDCVAVRGVCVAVHGDCVVVRGVCVADRGVCVVVRGDCVADRGVCVVVRGVCIADRGVCVVVRKGFRLYPCEFNNIRAVLLCFARKKVSFYTIYRVTDTNLDMVFGAEARTSV
jgi:hypothetical protein